MCRKVSKGCTTEATIYFPRGNTWEREFFPGSSGFEGFILEGDLIAKMLYSVANNSFFLFQAYQFWVYFPWKYCANKSLLSQRKIKHQLSIKQDYWVGMCMNPAGSHYIKKRKKKKKKRSLHLPFNCECCLLYSCRGLKKFSVAVAKFGQAATRK